MGSRDDLGGGASKPIVLIVDDEPLNRRMVSFALNATHAYELRLAEDGVAAQAVLSREHVDVVVTDLTMPNMGGLDLLRWASVSCPGPTWIIHSALDSFDAAVQALQLGAFDFVVKPLPSVRLLQSSVNNAVRQRRLLEERERLRRDLERTNGRLRGQVVELEELCRLLREQAETIQQDLHRAELIQRALLPHAPPALDGFSVDAVYRPSQSVGGDLYDVARLDDHHVALYVADAAGHGVSSAMLSVVLKHRLRMVDPASRPIPPAEVLTALNNALLDECAAPGLFITVAYCLLDTSTRALTVASAGHPPVAVCRAGGSVELLERTGPALGLGRDARFDERHLVLERGDRVLLHTDGLCDVGRDGKGFEPGAATRAVAEGGPDSPALLHGLLEAAARARGGAPNEDDVTLVLLTTGGVGCTLDNGVLAPMKPPATVQPEPLASTGAAAASPSAAATPAPDGPAGGEPSVGIASSDELTWVGISGRATWVLCTAAHEACAAALDAGRALIVDLSRCPYLDSTWLGTLHELVAHEQPGRPAMRVQGAAPGVRQLFDELSMGRVLARLAPGLVPAPAPVEPLAIALGAKAASERRILRAHEALLDLSDRNREQFQGVVDALRAESRPAAG